MILNHKSAIQFISDNASNLEIDKATLFAVHAHLAENLVGDRRLEGALRKHEVTISNSVYGPNANPYQIEQWFTELAQKAGVITDPLEQSFFLLVHLPYLQPFGDVNMRTARVAANLPLIKAELCPLSFLDVPRSAHAEGLLGVYELRRIELMRDVFAWAYERSCQQYRAVVESLGTPDPLRQTYRMEMREFVRATIRNNERPDATALEHWARITARESEDVVPLFISMREELENLRPELASRYDLRAPEVEAWLVG